MALILKIYSCHNPFSNALRENNDVLVYRPTLLSWFNESMENCVCVSQQRNYETMLRRKVLRTQSLSLSCLPFVCGNRLADYMEAVIYRGRL